MTEWSRFERGGDTFIASLPDSAAEAQVFAICVMRGDRVIRSETVPLIHQPIFGPDVGDVAALEERVEEIVTELGLKEHDDVPGTP
jgi:hypothetical protein